MERKRAPERWSGAVPGALRWHIRGSAIDPEHAPTGTAERPPARRGRGRLTVRRAVPLAFLAAISALTVTTGSMARPPGTPSSLDPGAFRAVAVADSVAGSTVPPPSIDNDTSVAPARIGDFQEAEPFIRAPGQPGSARARGVAPEADPEADAPAQPHAQRERPCGLVLPERQWLSRRLQRRVVRRGRSGPACRRLARPDRVGMRRGELRQRDAGRLVRLWRQPGDRPV